MCGIAGLLGPGDPGDLAATVAAMCRALAHRGPDGEGIHTEPGVALGHRRLAILDLSQRGAQPMSNEDGTLWLTYNGEIYNFRALRAGLEARGHRFRSAMDGETLLHLYEEHADDPRRMLDGVRGMFAFGIWDRTRRRLLLARDRFGIKPLVYWHDGDRLAFASDLDALAEVPGLPRQIDPTALYEYLLYLTVPGPCTIFQGVRHLPPGTLLLAGDGGAREIEYWRLDPARAEPLDDPAAAAAALEETLAEAIALHLVSDVEVGAFLSGGLDSGLVTAFAARAAGRPLATFTAAFPGEAVDEGAWARQTAARLGTDHAEWALEGGLFDGLEEAVAAMDQPLALTSALSLFQIARLARARVKVVLTGDGGDEVFAGYSRHRPDPPLAGPAGLLPKAAHPALGRFLLRTLPQGGNGRLGSLRALARGLARDEAERYLPRLWTADPADILALLAGHAPGHATDTALDTGRTLERLRTLFDRHAGLPPLTRRLAVDLQTSLADEMLAKVDRMTMAWGLEARVPLLDHRVVEVGLAIADQLKRGTAPAAAGSPRPGGGPAMGKLPLRRLAGPLLGTAAAGRAKQGFNAPLERWLAGDAATRTAFERLWPAVADCGFFDPAALARIKQTAGQPGGSSTRTLFALLVFGLWAGRRTVRAA
jgi:asparagine synthase (glutamine-hydrolysing)